MAGPLAKFGLCWIAWVVAAGLAVASTQVGFELDSGDCVLQDQHLWVFDRTITIRPGLGDVGGVQGFFCPPIAAGKTSVSFRIDGQTVPAGSYVWRPGGILRTAEAHGLKVVSDLTISGDRSFILGVELSNTTDKPVSPSFEWRLQPRIAILQSADWGWWVDPAYADWGATESGDGSFSYAGYPLSARASVDMSPTDGGTRFAGHPTLMPGERRSFWLSMAAGSANASHRTAELLKDPSRSAQNAKSATERWVRDRLKTLPEFESSSRDLEALWRVGLSTFVSCVWDSPDFVFRPYLAESGIDGGAICSYPWGIAYIARILPMADPKLARRVIVQALRSDPFKHYAYTPLDGTPIGPWYSYNQYSIVRMVREYVCATGDTSILKEKVSGKTVLAWLVQNATFRDDLSQDPDLVDFGDDHNLLELRRTDAYRHYVPSPNAERCWSYRAIDDLAPLAGQKVPRLSERAEELATVIRQKLWNPQSGWFDSLTTTGDRSRCGTIQVFDLLRCGIMTGAQRRAVVSHLNEVELLSEFGVHSLAKNDPGFDPADVDWGGPGVYAGDAPELIEDLWAAGFGDEGDDLLRRIAWWGHSFPYLPQAIRADRRDYRRDGRANVVAGFKVNEMLLFGLLGLEVSPEGEVSLCPRLPSGVDTYAFRNIRLRGSKFGIDVSRAGAVVRANGKAAKHYRLGIRAPLRQGPS